MNDYEVVVRGLRTMLEPYAERVRVVELDSQLPVVSDVDVLLYDAFSRERVVGPVREVLDETSVPVVIFTWHVGPDLVSEALAMGAAGVVSKSSTAEELVEALELAAAGAPLATPKPHPEDDPAGGDWPGR